MNSVPNISKLSSVASPSKLANYIRSEGDPKLLRSGPSALPASDLLARALGWFSLGLGLAELIAPATIARALGMKGKEPLLRAYGARELGAGIMSLSVDKQRGLWSRVAGDGLDIATLLPALRQGNEKRGNATIALALVLGITALDVIGAQATTSRHKREPGKHRDYSDRSGFPEGLPAARSAARSGVRRGSRGDGLDETRGAADPTAQEQAWAG